MPDSSGTGSRCKIQRESLTIMKGIGSYHAEMEESDKDADIYARREVNRFLSARTSAILLEGYEVPGITARFALRNYLVYQKEGKCYEHTGIR